jgi:hypothetical protein
VSEVQLLSLKLCQVTHDLSLLKDQETIHENTYHMFTRLSYGVVFQKLLRSQTNFGFEK